MNVLYKITEFTPAAGFIMLVFLIVNHTFYLKKKGVKIGSASALFSGKSILITSFFALLLLIFLSGIFSPVFHLSFFPKVLTSFVFNSVIIRIIGAVLVLVSVLLMKTTLKNFSVSLRFGLNKNNTGQLVTNGVFSYSRNPFFLSLLLYFVGVALVFPNFFFLTFALAAFAGIHFSILKEEKFLLKIYGENYKNYAAKVHRYF